MNPDSNNEGLMYKAAGFAIFVVLIALIILITVSADSSEAPNPAPGTDSAVTTAPIERDTTAQPVSAQPKQTETPPVTAPVTDKAPETAPVTAPVTDAPETAAPKKPDTDTAAASVKVDAPTGNTSDEIAAYLAEHPNAVLAETADAGQEYIDKLIFLGDSTTYGLIPYKMLSGGRDTKQVWTPTNGTLTLNVANTALIYYPDTGKEITIKEAVQTKKPEYLVITLGVNGVSFMDEEYFKKEYTKLLDSIKEASPDTKIICQSIFPVARTYKSLKSINNQKIDAANKWICELADAAGVKYVDTNSVLRDSEGWLPENYHNGDGLHLKENSFTLELNNLRTHAWID